MVIVDKIQRLPIWAQEHIKYLNRLIEGANTQRDEAINAFTGGKETRVYVSGHSQPNMYLPENSRIVFCTGDSGEDIEVNLQDNTRQNQRTVAVRGDWKGLFIEPRVSNVIEIGVVKR